MIIRRNLRWRILALLFFATTINYIDRQVIGILKPFIAEDLGWDESDYGYIVTAFQMTSGTKKVNQEVHTTMMMGRDSTIFM
ncbi:MAG: hypothetical protein IMZ64_12190 [Bacteroidetes bacterium]|nr:hypothetical protein [Bacteroidota bacterium]